MNATWSHGFFHNRPKGQEIIEVFEIIELACEILHGLQLLQQWMFLKASSPTLKTDVPYASTPFRTYLAYSVRSASKCLYALINTGLNTSVQRPVISTSARKAVCESNSNEDCSMQRQLWLRTLLTPSMPQKQPPSLSPSFSSFCREFLVQSSWFKPRCPYLHKCFQDPLHLSSTANHSFSFSAAHSLMQTTEHAT